MHPYLTLWGISIPTYSLLLLLGLAAAWWFFHRRLKVRGENPAGGSRLSWGALGALVGPRPSISSPSVSAGRRPAPAGRRSRRLCRPVSLRGLCLYGGLFGALGAVWLFCRPRGFFPPGHRAGPHRPSPPRLWAGGVLSGRVLLWPPGPCRWPGVTFQAALLAPQGGSLSSPYSSMRPPGSSCFFCCWPGCPAGDGRGTGSCWSISPLTPPSAFCWNFSGAIPTGAFWGPCPPLRFCLWSPWRWSCPCCCGAPPGLNPKTPLTPFRFSVRGCRFILREIGTGFQNHSRPGRFAWPRSGAGPPGARGAPPPAAAGPAPGRSPGSSGCSHSSCPGW